MRLSHVVILFFLAIFPTIYFVTMCGFCEDLPRYKKQNEQVHIITTLYLHYLALETYRANLMDQT